ARRQAAIIDVGRRIMPSDQRTTSSVVFECDLPDPSKCSASLPVPAGGAGLSAAPVPGATGPAAGEEPQLVGMYFDATGVVMSSWVLLPTPSGEYLLVERGRVPAASIPNHVVTGDFDGDGRADLFWDLPSLTQPTSNFQATYGRTIGELRLSALSGAEPILVDDLIAGDLTGDGLDDLVIFGRQRREDDQGNVTITTGIIVVPMNVLAPNPDPTPDKPCP
ncbi:MAG TPA: VCBS repeat-containing protein, partial [Kofleriaceae bacterium]|nr:VCBS repeat-containing protein [Kofleriaceae bacterium]